MRLTQFEQPALAVGVEEGMSEVIAVVLRDGEGFALDAVEEVLSAEKGGKEQAVMSIPVRSLDPAGPLWPGNSPRFPQVAGAPKRHCLPGLPTRGSGARAARMEAAP